MKFFPSALFRVLERELRVHARSAATFWFRCAAATAAGVLVGIVLVGFEFTARMGGAGGGVASPTAVGETLFILLSYLGLWGAVGLGALMASDALARERREGTLALLFLTHLKAGDIVLGKLLAVLLRTLELVMAALPFAGIALLFGGVRMSDVAALGLAIANALFWSISITLMASAFCRDWHRALILALSLFALGAALPVLVEDVLQRGPCLTSPMRAVSLSHPYGRPDYWTSLLLVQLQAWACLALATWRLRRIVREGRGRARETARALSGGPPARASHRTHRRRPVGDRPVRWLARRDPWFAYVLNGAALVIAIAVVALAVKVDHVVLPIASMIGAAGLGLLVGIYVISQASRVFAESARNGVLELVAISRVSPGELVREQFRVLVRSAMFPVLVGIALQVAQIAFTQRQFQTVLGPGAGAGAGGAVTGVGTGMTLQSFAHFQTISLTFQVFTYPLSLAGLAWFAMLMGLMSHQPAKAFLLTVGLGWFAPGLVLGMLGSLTAPLLFLTNAPVGVTVAVLGALGLLTHGAILYFSRRYLYRRFRELVLGGYTFASLYGKSTRRLPEPPRFSTTPPPPPSPPPLLPPRPALGD